MKSRSHLITYFVSSQAQGLRLEMKVTKKYIMRLERKKKSSTTEHFYSCSNTEKKSNVCSSRIPTFFLFLFLYSFDKLLKIHVHILYVVVGINFIFATNLLQKYVKRVSTKETMKKKIP